MFHIHWMNKVQGMNSLFCTYYECRCGKRTVRTARRGYGPIDWDWLTGGRK